MFKKAVKHESKLRMAICGPSGGGKTYTSLSIASKLGKIAFIDTEHGSASKYADIFDFDVLELEAPFHPHRFIEALQTAQKAGYDVVIIDSTTHEWSGPGGVLDEVNNYAKKMNKPNSYIGWGHGTKIHNQFIEAILASKVHVIATMRSKTAYLQGTDAKGKMTITKAGTEPLQRDGFEYEFDIIGDMDIENSMIISKSRCSVLAGKVIDRPNGNLSETILTWLGGEKREENPTPSPKPKVENESKFTRIQLIDRLLEKHTHYKAGNHILNAVKSFKDVDVFEWPEPDDLNAWKELDGYLVEMDEIREKEKALADGE